MRLYSFQLNDQVRIGAESRGLLVDLNTAHAARTKSKSQIAASMLELIQLGEAGLRSARQALAFVADNPVAAERCAHRLSDVKILAPIPRPGKILCCGLNYQSHVKENPKATFLEDPRFFIKSASAVIGPGEPIRWPGAKFQVDYEVELAVVIGKTGRRLTRPDTMGHVFGYTILHDVSARWIQFKDKNEDMGKNFDTFCPMGPCIVTADEIPDPSLLRLTLKLNGETMQDGTNRDWCFPLSRLLEWFTIGITLEPGDVVTTGTPAGIGYFRDPQLFLKPGDRCELEIEGIGKLINPVVADEYHFAPSETTRTATVR